MSDDKMYLEQVVDRMDNWQRKPKYSDQTRPSVTLSTTDPTSSMGSNLDCLNVKRATNGLSYSKASITWYTSRTDCRKSQHLHKHRGSRRDLLVITQFLISSIAFLSTDGKSVSYRCVEEIKTFIKKYVCWCMKAFFKKIL
jgi:hypothetical protein